MLTDKDIQKIKGAFEGDFTGIRIDIKDIRTDIQKVRGDIVTLQDDNKSIKSGLEAIRLDIANHDHRFDELAEGINRIHEDLSVKRDVERIKGFLREKMHAEI